MEINKITLETPKKPVLGGLGQEIGPRMVKIPLKYCCFHTSAQRCYFLANLRNSCEFMDFSVFHGKSRNPENFH